MHNIEKTKGGIASIGKELKSFLHVNEIFCLANM